MSWRPRPRAEPSPMGASHSISWIGRLAPSAQIDDRDDEQQQQHKWGFGAVVAEPETHEAELPGNGALHDPAMAARVVLVLDAAAGDAHLDATPLGLTAAPKVVISPCPRATFPPCAWADLGALIGCAHRGRFPRAVRRAGCRGCSPRTPARARARRCGRQASGTVYPLLRGQWEGPAQPAPSSSPASTPNRRCLWTSPGSAPRRASGAQPRGASTPSASCHSRRRCQAVFGDSRPRAGVGSPSTRCGARTESPPEPPGHRSATSLQDLAPGLEAG